MAKRDYQKNIKTTRLKTMLEKTQDERDFCRYISIDCRVFHLWDKKKNKHKDAKFTKNTKIESG